MDRNFFSACWRQVLPVDVSSWRLVLVSSLFHSSLGWELEGGPVSRLPVSCERQTPRLSVVPAHVFLKPEHVIPGMEYGVLSGFDWLTAQKKKSQIMHLLALEESPISNFSCLYKA